MVIIFLLFFIHLTNSLYGKIQYTYTEIVNSVNKDRLVETHNFFATRPSRVVGYPGCEEAANYIYRQFSEIGLNDVKKEEFFVTVPIDRGAWLEVENVSGRDKIKLKLYSLWPNLVRTSSLPSSGLRGALIYGGSGELETFSGKEIYGRIILLEFNCGSRWVELAMLGARAIIFIEPENTLRGEAERKFLQLPMDIPRFWISKKDALLLKSKLSLSRDGVLGVKLYARMDWARVPSWNIMGIVPGKDKKLKEEIIVIESYYDSMSVVPSLSPGAESACGITTLLELARLIKLYPVSRTVLFLATSGHYLHCRGVDAFIHSHTRKCDPFVSKITDPIDVKLFIGLDISSQNDQLGIWHGSGDFYMQRYHAPFGKILWNMQKLLFVRQDSTKIYYLMV